MLVPAYAGAYFHYDEAVSWQNAEINYPGQFLHNHTTYSWGQVAPFAHMSPLADAQDKRDATFIMRQGLTGEADTVSFQSAFTDEYLRQGDLGNSWAGLGFAADDGTDAFKQDATFKIKSLQVGDVSGADLYRFESVSRPGEYIVGTRGSGDEGNVWLTKDDGTTQFQYDSTWERQAPAATDAANNAGAGNNGGGDCAGADTPITQDTIGAAEDTIACLVNKERKKAGLGPLSANGTLHGTATAHSTDMVDRQFFAHTNPDDETFCDRIQGAGWPGAQCQDTDQGPRTACTNCRENIAYRGAGATPNDFMYDPQYGWMTHPEPNQHREAILGPYNAIGVGVVIGDPEGGDGVTATQDFGG